MEATSSWVRREAERQRRLGELGGNRRHTAPRPVSARSHCGSSGGSIGSGDDSPMRAYSPLPHGKTRLVAPITEAVVFAEQLSNAPGSYSQISRVGASKRLSYVRGPSRLTSRSRTSGLSHSISSANQTTESASHRISSFVLPLPDASSQKAAAAPSTPPLLPPPPIESQAPRSPPASTQTQLHQCPIVFQEASASSPHRSSDLRMVNLADAVPVLQPHPSISGGQSLSQTLTANSPRDTEDVGSDGPSTAAASLDGTGASTHVLPGNDATASTKVSLFGALTSARRPASPPRVHVAADGRIFVISHAQPAVTLASAAAAITATPSSPMIAAMNAATGGVCSPRSSGKLTSGSQTTPPTSSSTASAPNSCATNNPDLSSTHSLPSAVVGTPAAIKAVSSPAGPPSQPATLSSPPIPSSTPSTISSPAVYKSASVPSVQSPSFASSPRSRHTSPPILTSSSGSTSLASTLAVATQPKTVFYTAFSPDSYIPSYRIKPSIPRSAQFTNSAARPPTPQAIPTSIQLVHLIQRNSAGHSGGSGDSSSNDSTSLRRRSQHHHHKYDHYVYKYLSGTLMNGKSIAVFLRLYLTFAVAGHLQRSPKQLVVAGEVSARTSRRKRQTLCVHHPRSVPQQLPLFACYS